MDTLVTSKRTGIGMTSSRTRDRMVARLRENGIRNESVLSTMGKIPRHIFVDDALSIRAYEDVSLPIGYGQTISQPYIVAYMTELLIARKKLGRVLEVGTGCGYQTAVLAQHANEVYSVERISALLMKARNTLRTLRLDNIKLKVADGSLGIPEAAPFDGIMVTAASNEIPMELLEQLAMGGRLVIPVGVKSQRLNLIERTEDGYRRTELDEVKFVPLIRNGA